VRCLWLLLLLASGAASAQPPTVEIRELAVDFSPFSLVAEGGEQLHLGMEEGLSVTLAGKATGEPVATGWTLTAPTTPGVYLLRVSGGADQIMDINLFVTVPASAIVDEQLNGYRMGPSPPGHRVYPELFRAPTGFVEVSEAMLDLQVSPHFRLRQLLCKQEGGFPKYIALRESLLVLLEGLLGEVRSRGYPAETFGVISGYRTPWYNRRIGNVANSRHVYGDAMDLYIDVNEDGMMDDLDGDGDQDRDDVKLLADLVEEYMARPGNALLFGGVGRYGKTSRHGGFVHVDTRGYAARW
jgi:peptidase M15-like protein